MNESGVGEVPSDEQADADPWGQRNEPDAFEPIGPKAVRASVTLGEATALAVWTAIADYFIYRTYG